MNMKWTMVVFAIAAISGVVSVGPVSAQTGSNLIIAGKSVGQTHLGRYGAAYLARLPAPDADDSGMGQYRSVWLSRKQGGRADTLYIYSVANGPREIKPFKGVSIQLIRVTSPWYRTPDGLSTGSRLDQILRRFPHARPGDDSQGLYVDAKQGIAFEFAGHAAAESRCIAISVFSPGDENVHVETAQEIDELLRSNGIPLPTSS
jgi:hypothetical protein